MDLRFTDAEVAFAERLRAWLADTLPTLPAKPERDEWPARRGYDTAWQRLLFDAGYAGVDWPAEHGGLGASPTEQLISLEETARARAPYIGPRRSAPATCPGSCAARRSGARASPSPMRART